MSERSASALWHAIDLSPEDGDIIVWRWKVERSLLENRKEREKRGDDYSARLFVIFDGEPFSREARAVCYVWASNEPVGSVYRSPFFSNVVTVVLESGTERVGEWVPEARHFVQDYRAAFGANPRTVTAVAVMVDTDNTGGRAVTWFDGIGVRRNAIEAAVGRDSAPRH